MMVLRLESFVRTESGLDWAQGALYLDGTQ